MNLPIYRHSNACAAQAHPAYCISTVSSKLQITLLLEHYLWLSPQSLINNRLDILLHLSLDWENQDAKVKNEPWLRKDATAW
eukprot:scaffold69224_cov22-Cyclotella_meneghiniana.AAC.1